MTHPLTPREKVEYWLDLALTSGANRQDFNMSEAVSGILTALASGSGDHSGGVTDMIGSGDQLSGNPGILKSGDHAELLASLRKPEIWQSYPGPEGDFEIRRAPFNAADALEALLAEIAALRASVVKANDGFEEYERRFYLEQDRATEAERKLTEAEARLERWEPKPFCPPSVSSGISKGAERG